MSDRARTRAQKDGKGPEMMTQPRRRLLPPLTRTPPDPKHAALTFSNPMTPPRPSSTLPGPKHAALPFPDAPASQTVTSR
ncbi:hypothetical protein B9479_008267 [Cryptococcus floricola]|uniref:Uncharacterized protein n=1 Tax=Cryptococcus floricola TaxID=2591691 RepID=A0A5D3AKJ7_9TREE|nr:hypothetical protein B9479_008267 [Cryptococcus floricola]